MKVIKDYHIHSKFSKVKHAKNTVEEIVKKAVQDGLLEIAISNHGLKHISYGVRKKNLIELRKEINDLNNKYDNINILLGIEANLLSLGGNTDIDDVIVKNCDVILFGYHTFVKYSTFIDAFHFLVLNKLAIKFGLFKERIRRKNTDAIINSFINNKINILTHPGEKLIVDIEKIAKAAERYDVMLEINTNHKHLSVEEILICKKYNVKYIISSDAHDISIIGDYTSAINRIKESDLEIINIYNIRE